MRVRGERVCQSCGTHWSYYETGDVACPSCGSPQSVGVGERADHTDTPVAFDLSPVRDAVGSAPREDVATRAADAARTYSRRSGFVHAGDLTPLSDIDLAAAELREVAREVARGLRLSDAAHAHYVSLLRGADAGDRPPVDAVPPGLRAERGRAIASTVEVYQSAVRRVTDEPRPEALRRVLSRLRTRRKRIDALEGDVPPRRAERLVDAARDLGEYCRSDDEAALVTAGERLQTE